MPKLKPVTDNDDSVVGYRFFCAGCDEMHWFQTAGKLVWDFDGNMDAPTFSPSLLMDKDRPERRCHLFLKDGKLQYLSDCHHALAGKTVDLPDLPY